MIKILRLIAKNIFEKIHDKLYDKKGQSDLDQEKSKSKKTSTIEDKKVMSPLVLDKPPITMTIDERKEACDYMAEHISKIESIPNGDIVLRGLKYSCVEAVRRERIGKSITKSIPYPYGWITSSLEMLRGLLQYLSNQEEYLFTTEERNKIKEKIRDIKVNLGTLDRLVAKNLVEAIKKGQLLPENREMLSFSGTILLNLDVYTTDNEISRWAEDGAKILGESSYVIKESCKDKECEERMMSLLQIITNPDNYYNDKK